MQGFVTWIVKATVSARQRSVRIHACVHTRDVGSRGGQIGRARKARHVAMLLL